jgi:hypothetical protein
MTYVCSEISNRGVGDVRLRRESEKFAKLALSHSRMFAWEYQTDLVNVLGYRTTANDSGWIQERREKAELWLQAWRRLEKELDPNFDINDRKNQPSLRVLPPFETRLPPGTPPSAIKDPKLRAQYEAAIIENERKRKKAIEQGPLISHGPAFKAQAEHWLVSAYSQAPTRTQELRSLLEIFIKDAKARERVLDQVRKNSSKQTFAFNSSSSEHGTIVR